MSFKYFLKWAYWKLIYQRVLANKIYNLTKPILSNVELPSLLAEWRRLRTKYDGAEYDKKGYWLH
ncbi:hypothetical protein ES705_39742 [subsurface metagenome]